MVVGDDPRYATTLQRVAAGKSVSDAFRDVVDPLDAALLTAGERDGSLERTFDGMAETHEAASRERRERTTAQFYPLVLAHVAAVLMALPSLFQGSVGGALAWALAILVPVWAWILVSRKLDASRRPGVASGVPPKPWPEIGPFRSRTEEADARALEALGRLYESGVPIQDAVALAQRAGWGGRAAVDLEAAKGRVARGQDLEGAFTHVPSEITRRIATAETTGSLGTALTQAAEELRFGAGMRRKRTATVLPLALFLIVAAIIAIRVFAFYGSYFARLQGL